MLLVATDDIATSTTRGGCARISARITSREEAIRRLVDAMVVISIVLTVPIYRDLK